MGVDRRMAGNEGEHMFSVKIVYCQFTVDYVDRSDEDCSTIDDSER